MSLPRYSEYKDSGVAWLGEVPGHWEVKQGRRLYSQKRDSALPSDEQLSATQKYGVVPQRLFMEMEDQKVTLALSGLDNFKHVEKDDFVISLRSFQGGIERSKYSGCVSPAYTVLRPACQIEAGFMSYLLKSAGYIAALQTVTDGIRDGKNISYEQFGQIKLPFPVFAEQQTIATFLDRETGKIDALIAEQQRLVELLAEKRQAVISHAVTKGLNPSARMKDSGIEWLGVVPEHWDVLPLKQVISQIESGVSVNASDCPASDSELGVLKTSCVYSGQFDANENKTVIESEIDRVSCSLKAGTLIVSRMNTPELVGAAGLVKEAPENIYLPDRLWQVSFSSAVPAFVHYWTQSVFYRAQIRVVCAGTSSSMQNLGQDQFRSFDFPNPPHAEQQSIAAFLDTETAKFDTLTAEANRAIELLQERRSALITAAVTGKIDVREFA